MRLIFIVVMTVILSLPLAAQQVYFRDQPDQVGLKNGMVVEGELTHYRRGEYLALKRKDGLKMKIKVDDIWFVRQNEKDPLDLPAAFFLRRDLFPDSVQVTSRLHLKTGQVIVGKLKSFRKGETVTMETERGETLVYAEEEIERIEQQVVEDEREKKKLATLKTYDFGEQGWYGTAAFSSSSSRNFDQVQTGIGLHAVLGYQFHLLLGTGIGVGYDVYRFQGEGESFIPVYLEIRGYLFRSLKAPYYFVNGGYGFPGDSVNEGADVQKFTGGWMLHPGLGYRFGAGKSKNFTLDLGYKFQHAYLERTFIFNGDFERRTINYRRFTIRVGMVF